MDTNTWERIEAIFNGALERPAAERAAFLDRACAGDAGLRSEVEAMLAVHEDGAGMRVERVLLDTAGREGAGPPARDVDGRGRRVGPWRLERLLGQGGMGEVWLAARDDGQYHQHAALKLVRPGWRAAQLVPRFRRERQLLARLQHPSIATLLDGGLTDDGFPYLAMEFVDGQPVTSWCDARGSSLRERLALFREICEAVRFAHANLVVHRDLKPQNILVTESGRPVLLDFGIATILDPDDGSPPITRDEDRVLTPEHAAPEQLRGEPATVATDVWALGVLLYELLTGRRPFSGEDCTPVELERRVLHDEPPPPGDVAASREAARALRGDLGRIVMKALRKEPQRRYRSADDLAEDVRRWLEGLPVLAAPDSLRYRARKFVRRNRVALAVAGLMAALVLGFAMTAAWQARLIARERDAAVAARGDSDAAVAMLVDIFQMGDPGAARGADSLRIDDLLRSAEEKLSASQESPRVRTKLWRTLAGVHAARSRFDAQERALDRALEAARQSGSEIDRLAVLHEQARFVLGRDGPAAAEPLLRESLARHEAFVGPLATDIAIAAQDLASVVTDRAEQTRLLERSLAIRRRHFSSATHDDSLGLAAVLNALAASQLGTRRPEDAMVSFREALALVEAALPPDHGSVLAVRSNLAQCLQAAGRLEEAEALHRRTLESRRRLFGDESAWVAASLDNLGVCLVHQGRHAEAVEVLREAATLSGKVHGAEHHATAAVMSDLGIALVRAGRADEGLAVYDSTRDAVARGGAAAVTGFHVRRLRLEHVGGRPVSLDSLRALAAELHAGPEVRPLVLELIGIVALESPGLARPGEAEAAFEEVLSRSAATEPAESPKLAGARCGREAARAAAGLPFDRKALRQALDAYAAWGLSDPGLVRLARRALDAPRAR
jgi:serine/threonine-protein kinase